MNIPHLNQQRCFKLIPPKDLSVNSQKLPSDWLDRLAIALHDELPTETENLYLKQELIRHTRNQGYHHTEELTKALQHIYLHVFSDHAPSLNPDLKKKIADKLIESIASCTQGYHTCVNEALGSYSTPQTIDELLSIIRNGLITNITFKNNLTNVHSIAGFFNLANELHLGITASKDPVAYYYNSEYYKNLLITAFETHYRPIAIFEDLTNQINGILRESFGYHGLAKNSTECYDLTDCEAMLSYLKSVLGLDMDLDPKDYFIMSLRSEWTDLNWPKINRLLFTQLINKGYFHFTPHEINCLNALFEANVKGSWNTILDREVNILKAALRQEYGYQGAVEPESAYQPEVATQFFDHLKNILCFETPEDSFFEQTTDGEIIDINWKQVRQECFAFFQELGCLPFTDLSELSQITSLEEIDFTNFPELESMMLFLKEFTDTTILEKYLDSKETETLDEACEVLKRLLTTYSENITLTCVIKKLIEKLTRIPELEQDIISWLKRTLYFTPSNEQIALAMGFFNHLTPSLKINFLLSEIDRTNIQHDSLLMIVAKHHPEILSSLISSIPDDALDKILPKQNVRGDNLLMILAKQHPKSLLDVMRSLSSSDLSTLLLQTNQDEETNDVFMIAAKYHSIDLMQKLIEISPPDYLENMLIQQNSQGDNLLRVAARYHPEMIPLLIQTSNTDDVDVIKAKNLSHKNALKIVSEYHPAFLPVLIQSLPAAYFRGMLTIDDLGEQGIFLLILQNHPDVVLDMIKNTMENELTNYQITLFSKAIRNSNHAYKKEFHIALQLAKLAEKASEFKQHSEAYEKAKTLHTTLNTAFKTYLHSDHQPSDLMNLQTATQAAMNTAHRTLATHRGYKDFWVQALICVTGIGLLCLLAKKALDYYQVGFFRPITNTKSVSIMNTLQEEINALAPSP